MLKANNTYRVNTSRSQRNVAMFVSAVLAGALTSYATPDDADTTDANDSVTVIKAATAHVGDGRVIQDAVLVIVDGRITAVGPADWPGLRIPDDASIVDLREQFPHATLTPGLIDANALIEPTNLLPEARHHPAAAPAELQAALRKAADGDTTTDRRADRSNVLAMMLAEEHDPMNCAVCEPFANCALASAHAVIDEDMSCPVCGYPNAFQHLFDDLASGVRPGLVLSETSSEIVPHTHVIDSLNLRSPDFDRLLNGGVTTVFASPEGSVVIGPRGAITRTGGPVRQRVVEPSADVTAVVSADAFRGPVRNATPSRFRIDVRTRRPNTRMGLAWVFRKALYDARRFAEGHRVYGADTPPEEAFPALNDMLAGTIGLRIHARMQHDIMTSIRLAEEFGLTFTLLEATEAYRTIGALQERNIPVIFGPIYIEPSGQRARSFETRDNRLATFAQLLNSGIVTALSAQDLRDEDGLARQVMYAVRSGVKPADAIRAVTQTPAKLLGIADRVGTLEAGKNAEIVLWNHSPHEPGARPLLVMIDGRIVLDDRN